MSLFCPRDRSKLSWFRFALSGRWACERCQGSLIFDRHLKTHAAGTSLLEHIVQAPSRPSDLRCPSCSTALKAIAFGAGQVPGQSIEIDRCDSCKLNWFDPSEIKLLAGAETAPSDPPRSLAPIRAGALVDPAATSDQTKDLAVALLDFHDHSGDRRWSEIRPLARAACFALIGASIAMLILTGGSAHEYLSNIRRGRSPAGYACSALIFSLVFSFRPRKLWWAGALATAALFQSLLTWLARF